MSDQIKEGSSYTLKKRGPGGKVIDQTKVTVTAIKPAGRGHAVHYVVTGKSGAHRVSLGDFLKKAA